LPDPAAAHRCAKAGLFQPYLSKQRANAARRIKLLWFLAFSARWPAPDARLVRPASAAFRLSHVHNVARD